MRSRILLADDHEIVRTGLRTILAAKPEWVICGETGNGRDTVEAALKLKPDLVIMDISMPGVNGLSATRRIVKELPRTSVLILTMHESEYFLREIFDAGARGFILKSDAATELIAAVEALLEQKPFFTHKVSEIMLQGYLKGRRTRGAAEAPLTAREHEVMQLLAEGKTNKDVAESLQISVKTAETHRSHIMAKLRLRNLGELVRYAVRNGLIQA